MAHLRPPRPLAETDDRSGFDCGREAMNQWFRRHAWDNQQSNISRTTVFCDAGDGVIAGYITLSMGQIERAFMPKAAQRNTPAVIPVFLLGQLAVDLRFQGQGLSKSLLFYAFNTAVHAARDIGSFGVLTHPLDESAREFYRHFGFEELPGDARRSMIIRIRDLVKSGFGAAISE